jgi:hypothetical protein
MSSTQGAYAMLSRVGEQVSQQVVIVGHRVAQQVIIVGHKLKGS